MLEIYIDGATQGYPGDSGIGFVIKNGRERIEGYAHIGLYTNHEAEFKAFIHVLDYCQKYYPDQILSVRSDSKLVVDLVNRGGYNKEPFKSLVSEALEKIDRFPHVFIKWIPDKQNKQADRLAKQAIHVKGERINKYPSV